MSRGTITEIFYDRLYGLIDTDDDGEKKLYFQRNEVLPKIDDFFELEEGDRVGFEIEIGRDRGSLIATRVKPDRLIDRPDEFMKAPFCGPKDKRRLNP